MIPPPFKGILDVLNIESEIILKFRSRRTGNRGE
jgi:hypothetical protein